MKIVIMALALALSTAAVAATITKRNNGDGTVTFESGGKKAGSKETMSSEQGKRYEKDLKAQGHTVKEVKGK